MLGPAFMRQRLRRPRQRHDERDGGRRVRLPVGVGCRPGQCDGVRRAVLIREAGCGHGPSLPDLMRERLPRGGRLVCWSQAETVSISCCLPRRWVAGDGRRSVPVRRPAKQENTVPKRIGCRVVSSAKGVGADEGQPHSAITRRCWRLVRGAWLNISESGHCSSTAASQSCWIADRRPGSAPDHGEKSSLRVPRGQSCTR